MKKTIAVSLSLACGACTGWAFALALDLARTPPAELAAPKAPDLAAPKPPDLAAPKAALPEAEPETVELADEEGCD